MSSINLEYGKALSSYRTFLTMDSIKREVKKFINDEDADASTRHEVSTELRALAASIENPREAVERHAYSV